MDIWDYIREHSFQAVITIAIGGALKIFWKPVKWLFRWILRNIAIAYKVAADFTSYVLSYDYSLALIKKVVSNEEQITYYEPPISKINADKLKRRYGYELIDIRFAPKDIIDKL